MILDSSQISDNWVIKSTFFYFCSYGSFRSTGWALFGFCTFVALLGHRFGCLGFCPMLALLVEIFNRFGSFWFVHICGSFGSTVLALLWEKFKWLPLLPLWDGSFVGEFSLMALLCLITGWVYNRFKTHLLIFKG